MPKVSVIVPVYKVEKYIKECVDSLVNQTLKDIEIILVDDGSPDNCGKICDEYADKDSRVKVIHKKNEGVSKARNDGIANATSDYIMFVDSDDWCELNMCEVAYNTITEKEADIAIFTNFYSYSKSEMTDFKFPTFLQVTDKKNIEILQMTVLARKFIKLLDSELDYGGITAPWSKIFKKEVIKNNEILFNVNVKGLFDDGLFVMESLQYSNNVILKNIPLYHYRIIETSIVNSFNPNKIQIYNTIFDEIEIFMKKYNKDNNFKNAYYARMIIYFVVSLKNYYFNRLNNKKMTQKLRELRQLIKTPRYSEAIANCSQKHLSKTQKIYLNLCKLKSAILIMIFYKLKEIYDYFKRRKLK